MDTEAIERSCKYLHQLFLHTIENMKSSFSIWKDFTCKATKLHVALKSICSAVSSFLEAFQKMADLATNAKGATKEIGVALTRLCLRHRNIEKKLDHVTHTFENSLIGSVEDKLEEWKKLVFQIEKDHSRDSKKATRDYKKVSLQVEKTEKKNKKDANLLKELTSLNLEKREKLIAMETIEKSSVRSALLEERRRHCHVVLALKPFVDAEMSLLADLMHLEEIMASLSSQAQEPNVLPNSSEQVILDITSQTVPEGWSCQSTRSFPTPSDSLLSIYSVSNRSSIISEFETQSAIADPNLNASLSSLPVSLLRNHRAGGSVPPPLDRGCGRNGRPLYRQSLYNPLSGSQSSSTGIAYLQQPYQQRQKQSENGSRLLFPSTSAPTTPEVKLQPNVLISQGQHKVLGKPPTFPPSYLRRKGSFGRALHPTQPIFSPPPTSSVLPSFQSNWDSDRPRSLALGCSRQNQISHNFPEQMVCSLAPPASQNPSLSSTSTLKDEDEEDDDDQNTLRRPSDTLRKVLNNFEITRDISRPSSSSKVVSQTFTPLHSVPAKVVCPTRNSHHLCDPEPSNQTIQKRASPSQTRNERNEYASPRIFTPRRSSATNQNQQRPSFGLPHQQIIDGYKINSEMSNKNTPSPKSINYVDFHALSGVGGHTEVNGNTKSSILTNQVFINVDKNSISNSSLIQNPQMITSPMQVHSTMKSQNSNVKPDTQHRIHYQQHLAQLESEPHAYGIFIGKPVHSASYDQHFQEKILMFSPQLDNHGIMINPPHVRSSQGLQYSSPGHLGNASPSTKRHLQVLLNQTNTNTSFEGPWTLRAGSPDRSGSSTPTNEINSTILPPPPTNQINSTIQSNLPPPPTDQPVTPRSPLVYAPQSSQFDQTEQLPKGFVKHWENSV